MAELGSAGEAFFEALSPVIVKHREASLALLREASRCVDRLNDLDDIIDGKDVLNLLRFRLTDHEGKVAEVKFDGVMAESRQQQANFASLMKVLMPNLNAEAGAAKERDVLDEIAQRRSARGAGGSSGAVRSSGS